MPSGVIRHLRTPGQATSYRAEKCCWLEARERFRARDGAPFGLKEWHGAARNPGPMGLARRQRELAA